MDGRGSTDIRCSTGSADDAFELDEQAVADRFDNPTLVLLYHVDEAP
jgi:hypothetical protein